MKALFTEIYPHCDIKLVHFICDKLSISPGALGSATSGNKQLDVNDWNYLPHIFAHRNFYIWFVINYLEMYLYELKEYMPVR